MPAAGSVFVRNTDTLVGEFARATQVVVRTALLGYCPILTICYCRVMFNNYLNRVGRRSVGGKSRCVSRSIMVDSLPLSANMDKNRPIMARSGKQCARRSKPVARALKRLDSPRGRFPDNGWPGRPRLSTPRCLPVRSSAGMADRLWQTDCKGFPHRQSSHHPATPSSVDTFTSPKYL